MQFTQMAIAILPYGHSCRFRQVIADLPLNDLLWPTGERTPGLTVADLTADDHLILHASSRILTLSKARLKCRLNLLLQEPVAIKPRFYQAIGLFAGRYHRILTHSTQLLTKLSNARFTAHGGTFLPAAVVSESSKSQRISLIASSKNTTVGHSLRHRIAAWSKRASPDLKLYGTAYQRVEDKREAHDDFYFSVCIENSRTPGYFTEKLIDSFLCRSLPIYWGAPDIAHFFDPRGMICCSTESELQHTITTMTVADYNARLPYLEANIQRALVFSDFLMNAVHVLQADDFCQSRLSST